MRTLLIGITVLATLCSCRNARSAELTQAMQTLGQMTEEPTMAIEPEWTTEEAVNVGDVVEFDKTVHDFGDVSITDGPLSCTFTVKNIGKEPIAIFEVVTSCGCTDTRWTREPIQPGKTGTISATYKNEDGPLPFDKTLTVYIAGLKKPVILRLRGVVHEKKVALSELFGVHKLGAFGMKTLEYKAGNVSQGESVSETAQVANLGKTPLSVSFTDVSPQLTLHVEPSPIPAGSTATLHFTVRADRSLWGWNDYHATPVVGGRKGKPITVRAFSKENFESWNEEQRKASAQPVFDESSVSFDIVPAGKKVEAVFSFTNKGKSPLHIYSIDADNDALSFRLPADTPAGKKGSIPVTLDTSSLEKGETVIMLTLTTNCPTRPMVNLFLVGVIR